MSHNHYACSRGIGSFLDFVLALGYKIFRSNQFRFDRLWNRHIWLIGSAFLILGCSAQEIPAPSALSINDFLYNQEGNGFKKAFNPVPFQFPRDHGAHPKFKNEWWYITGNVEDASGRRFGFQFTLFRNAISAEHITSASRWATNQIYLAHVALTDVQRKRYYSDERFSRGALELAGVNHKPFKAWLEDWQIVSELQAGCASCFQLKLAVANDEFSLELNLSNTKPLVLHGDAGLSQKSETPGNASYYYSYTRLQTRGRIHVNDSVYIVHGHSWLDHEWSTSSLQDDQVGWDWFSVQLSDHTELMLFQLRHAQDPKKNFLYGTHVDSDGQATRLNGSGFSIESTAKWTSPVSGVVYPAGWNILIQNHGLKLRLAPLISAQELSASFRYWEGAVKVQGSRHEQPLQGYGYVELTGYK